MKPPLLFYFLISVLFFGCKKNKEEPAPETTFSYTILPNGLIRFSPSDASGIQEWNFGDNTGTTTGNPGEEIYHYYAEGGRYSVKLKTTSGLGGVYEFSQDVETGTIPTKGFITGITLYNFSDTIPDSDYSLSDVYFKINQYTANNSNNLFTSAVTINCDSSFLPLNINLSGTNKIEFPLQNSLVSVSALDDNSDSGNLDDELSYLGWYDYSYKPPATGFTFIDETDPPDFYPEEISTPRMTVTLSWQ